ncbi:hypothetical protein [Streptomyces sp. NBC_00620]|uniref:hypothetical protein n=1 Tax=Streptomyces sp. NBC_00620 TaxID=2903666 RepID=UPI00224D5FE6|nr:hypothetical protein [Streptomyces sp. NBC_00620]MCX4972983.1 hypothetical protein [Streptomyces sp. NBC_00620]
MPTAVAVDGKFLPGAIRADGRRFHLISALRDDGIVLAQREIDTKSSEIPAFHCWSGWTGPARW